jgi:Domain of unknown function (DUF4062)
MYLGQTMKRKLQVFVSSTFSDLRLERQAAVEAILKAGHIPAGMELFTAGDKSQMKTIERWIDESDVYMLILGGRYGSIEPTTNISYTELEYDYARAQGKPSFSVVIEEAALEEKVKSKGTDFMEKDNRKELAQFRAKVLSNISSFFNDLKDIKLCVHESLSDLATNSDLKGWVAAGEVEDTKLIVDELKKVKDENDALIGQLRRFESLAAKNGAISRKNKHDDLIKVLRAIKVTVPAEAAGGGRELTRDLLSLAFSRKEALIHGINNKAGMSAVQQFVYFNLLPKLQMYGLADNERVPGAAYRRGFLNKNGQELFAEFEKRQLLSSDEESRNAESAKQEFVESEIKGKSVKRVVSKKKAKKSAS